MAEILLTTLNAKYPHAAFGLRYLLANLEELAERAAIREFTINQLPLDILASILDESPRIVGFGIYIWNVEQTTKLIAALKRVRPEIIVILGGPEVSYETGEQEIVGLADYVITGEADLKFREVCEQLLSGQLPATKIIAAPVPQLDSVRMPYQFYDAEDVAHRVMYVEASRGCPFTCEFCLSALEIPVRQFPLEAFLEAMQDLFDRGARQFKFVDRTFNLNIRIGSAILEFFLERWEPDLFLHFEMIPDRLPEALRELIAKFPPGALQFEVGIQTYNDDVSERISRKQNNEKVAENFQFLREETGVHVHADLIVGLPGESLESFGQGFDRLLCDGPQEIQVGILKRLRGTPIIRHDEEFEMIYSPHPPYEILQTGELNAQTLNRLRRFARYWDLLGNSGNFGETLPLFWNDCSPFLGLLNFSDWLYLQTGKTYGISLIRLMEFVFEFLTTEQKHAREIVAGCLWRDYQRGGRNDHPRFLREFDLQPFPKNRSDPQSGTTGGNRELPTRQARHLSQLPTEE